ncbi:ergothioneine biosynthesis protein EgtB [Croceivirga lutea]|uniref:ergothioneine biosynthesis protein EgtB n=1 Tax=Croceivirga lutea TaxID=1775167 RepID=UPI00163A7C67|nr:ergothioneine biosynthesis protein EgtB [Croceivirga lutea]GGG53903.1 ergothioneine biosynthesis protein EgtB [Croceivirga lutea]
MILTASLLDLFTETRQYTERICEPLEIEDYVVQPIVDVSPPKWHLGHTTWFFEEFILKKYVKNYKLYSDDFAFVFNSYYETIGKRVVRSDRGNLSRPSVNKVYQYRKYVTQAIAELFMQEQSEELNYLLEIGIHHEKQHQELLLTDIKYILGNNPLLPKYAATTNEYPVENHDRNWISISEGLYNIGHKTNDFCYDNELGRHQVYIPSFEIANKLVTNAEFAAFIAHGGYQNFELWHAEGWDWVNQNKITAPLYWHKINGKWHYYSLNGLQEIKSEAPVTHISYYEAFAFAQFAGKRLPTEFEWEIAQKHFTWGKRWEWSSSAYLPYPNYKKADGALGEYNGKFMVNQKVLRGGSIATPGRHTRHTYRNFFHPQLRWQFTGLRLVK